MDSSKLLPQQVALAGVARGGALLPRIYPVTVLLVVIPLLDVAFRVWPLRPSDLTWRFGAMRLTLGTLTTPVLGLALAMIVAAALDQRRVLRALATLVLLLAVGLALALAVFALDFLELRAYLPAGGTESHDSAALEALIAGGLYLPVLLLLGTAGWSVTPRLRGPMVVPERVIGLGTPPRKENIT